VHDGHVMVDGRTDTYWNLHGFCTRDSLCPHTEKNCDGSNGQSKVQCEASMYAWVEYDFGKNVLLSSIAITQFGDTTHDVRRAALYTAPEPGTNQAVKFTLVKDYMSLPAGSTKEVKFELKRTTTRYARFQVIQTHAGWQPFVSELNFYYYSPTTTQTTSTTTTVATTSTTNTIIDYLSGKLEGIEAAMEKQILDTATKVDALEEGLKAARAENEALKLQLKASEADLKIAVEISEERSLARAGGIEAQVAALYIGLQNMTTSMLTETEDGAPADQEAPPLPAACKGAGSTSAPTVESGGDAGSSLQLSACSGEVLFTSRSCSVNPCATLAKVQRLASLLSDLGSNGGN